MAKNLENSIFDFAINAFKENFEVLVEDKKEKIQGDQIISDKLLRLKINGLEYIFCVEIKASVNKTVIAFLQEMQRKFQYPLLLIANFISPFTAEELKRKNIQFIDTSGNIYINNSPLFIFIKGNKPSFRSSETQSKRAFQGSGIKIIYSILKNKELINQSYREIAVKSKVALGSVGWVMRDLIEMGFLVDMGKRGKRIIDAQELFKRWCVEFSEKLKPKLLIDRFDGELLWWEHSKFHPNKGQWGGEVAANKLTNYLKPEKIIIYSDLTNYKDILIDNKLHKNANGNITFYERFWSPDSEDELKETVHPMIAYADLMDSGNERNIETAKIIYEQNIIRYFK